MIDALKPYRGYRETGEPLVGRIPSHWTFRRAKTLFHERVEKGHPEEPLLAATQSKGVVRKSEYGSRTVTVTKDFHLLKLVEVGDYVISLRSFEGGLEVCHQRGIISPAYTVLKPSVEASSGYFTKFFKSSPFVGGMTLFVTGIREGQNIDYERLSRAYLPLPPPNEQAAIVRFLTWAHRRLDKVVANKRRTITLLNEQKQAIILRAVTGGLDPNVKLKPSGIPWLGEIPEHWQVLPFWAVAKAKADLNPGGKQLLSVFLNRGVIRYSDGGGQVHAPSLDLSKYQVVEAGDFVMNNQQSWRGSVGVSEFEGIVSPAYHVYSLGNALLPRFADLLLRSRSMVAQYLLASKGVGDIQRTLYLPYLKTIRTPVPPKSDQVRIINRVVGDCTDIDSAVARLDHEVRLLVEYRTRLTADVVTGQLDVRQAAAGLPEEEPTDVEVGIEDGEQIEEEEEPDA